MNGKKPSLIAAPSFRVSATHQSRISRQPNLYYQSHGDGGYGGPWLYTKPFRSPALVSWSRGSFIPKPAIADFEPDPIRGSNLGHGQFAVFAFDRERKLTDYQSAQAPGYRRHVCGGRKELRGLDDLAAIA